MRVFLTGGTGFVGTYVLQALLRAGHRVRALVRNAGTLHAMDDAVQEVVGDVTRPGSFRPAMDGCDAVVHLVGIIEEKPSKGVTFERIHVEGTKHVAEVARAAGVGRFVHMSANGVAPQGTGYQTSKWQAEQHLHQLGFEHLVIFRPSFIFGEPPEDAFSFETQLADTLLKPFPILPILGDGRYKMRPVAVEEVASAFVQALTLDKANGQTYCVAGPRELTFNEGVDEIQRGMGRTPKPKLHQPLWLVRPVVNTLGNTGLLPISPAQFEMLVAGNTCDPAAFYRDFDVGTPKPFAAEHLRYVR